MEIWALGIDVVAASYWEVVALGVVVVVFVGEQVEEDNSEVLPHNSPSSPDHALAAVVVPRMSPHSFRLSSQNQAAVEVVEQQEKS